MKINEEKITNLLKKAVENIYPNEKFLADKLKSSEKMKIYFGVDPSGEDLHLGHSIPLRKLGEFQNLGHKIILLVGDFTAMIGDPTGKLSSRKQLLKEDVVKNFKTYKKQVSKFINFSGPNKAEIKFNSKWLAKLNLKEVLDLASLMTVDQMLKRDMFKRRIEEGKPVYIHEFLYPLLQGYDSVEMAVDGEIGGNDQTFNMLAGRDLVRNLLGKEKFVLTTKLLTDQTGKKMGKSEGNMITVNDAPENMFGKVMSWNDDMIMKGFELCTDLSLDEIAQIGKGLAKDENIMDIKKMLAFEVVSVFHGKKKAEDAKENFVKTFSKKDAPDNLQEILVPENSSLIDVLLKMSFVSSKSEFRRLIDQGAVKIGSQKVTDYDFKIKEDSVFKIGKRRFVKMKIKK